MATVNVGILTTAGKALVDRVNAGKAKVTYSKIVFSSMDNSALTDAQVEALTSITPADVTVSAPETTLDSGTGETKVRGTGDNQKLTSGVYIKTYGVYAKDDTGAEILYGVTVSDHPNYLVAFDGLTPQSVTYTYRTAISLTDNVTFTNGTDIYTTEQDMSDAIGALDKQVVHDPHDGSIEVNGKSYVPANDAKVVHTSETGDWQKQKITTDSGGSILIVMVADNIDFYDRINQLPTGVYSFYCQGGVPHNPTGTDTRPIRGLITVTTSAMPDIKNAFWYVFATDNLARSYTIYCNQGVYYVIKTADDAKALHLNDAYPQVLGAGKSFSLNTSGLAINDYPRFKAWGYYDGAGIAQTTAYFGVPRMFELVLTADLQNNGQTMIPRLLPQQIKDTLPEFDITSYTTNRASDGKWMYLISGPATIGIQCLNATFK